MARFERPNTLDRALKLLGASDWRLLAGGTDFYPTQGTRPVRDDVLDISALAELRGVERKASGWRIGALTTWTDIIRADLPPAFDMLKQAAREVGSVQIQNVGTVAGNLCNASPAADGAPPLLALDARVELRSATGMRSLPLSDFLLGNRRTARLADELVTAINIPAETATGNSAFVKLGVRRYLVISIAMAAARIAVERGRITHAAIAVGACSEVAQRLPALERDLVGQMAQDAATLVTRSHVAGLTPIDDVRGTADYRRDAARAIVVDALRSALALPTKDAA